MCTGTGLEGTLLTAALSGAGMYLQQQSAEDAANKQQKIINNAAEENLRLQNKKADTITDFAEGIFNPENRDKSYEAAAIKNESVLKDALLSASGGQGEIYSGTEGNLSNDYTRVKAKATADSTQDILNRTKLLARSNAGGLMYNDESLKGSQLASDIMGINASAERNNNAARVGAGAVRDKGSVLGGLLMAGSSAVPGVIKSNTWRGV